MSTAYTAEEVMDKLLANLHALADHWGKSTNDPQAAAEGMAFSMLVILDGESAALPPMDLVLCPHPDDKEYLSSRGERWFERGMVVSSDGSLHERFVRGG